MPVACLLSAPRVVTKSSSVENHCSKVEWKDCRHMFGSCLSPERVQRQIVLILYLLRGAGDIPPNAWSFRIQLWHFCVRQAKVGKWEKIKGSLLLKLKAYSMQFKPREKVSDFLWESVFYLLTRPGQDNAWALTQVQSCWLLRLSADAVLCLTTPTPHQAPTLWRRTELPGNMQIHVCFVISPLLIHHRQMFSEI